MSAIFIKKEDISFVDCGGIKSLILLPIIFGGRNEALVVSNIEIVRCLTVDNLARGRRQIIAVDD